METLFAEFDFTGWWLRPFSERWWQETVCSMLVGVTCGVLGCYVVLRRMALIGDALSHAVLPGVVIAFLITHDTGVFGLLAGALLAGVLTTVLVGAISRLSRTKEDSSIGIVFTALFAIGIILVSALPRGLHFDLNCFLFGDPLAVDTADLLLMAVICPLVLGIVFLLYHPLRASSFDPVVAAAMGIPVVALHYLLMGMLSATVVAGLKTTGVILVVALIITPASAAYLLTNRLGTMMLLSGIFGGLSAVAGMTLSFVTNWPSGATMVVFAATIFTLVLLLSPTEGLLTRSLQRKRVRRHIQGEDILKTLYRFVAKNAEPEQHMCSMAQIYPAARVTRRQAERIVAELEQEGLLYRKAANIGLTESGVDRAIEMVRSHRLWESYLTEHAGVSADEVHEQAEELEHVHDLADKIDQHLGHPERDPHGEAIPRPPKSSS
jgi:ABC-type Mn2+/Zn2+ transport system permease subunit/Mn-dependent DtxR family transcriptional regulator